MGEDLSASYADARAVARLARLTSLVAQERASPALQDAFRAFLAVVATEVPGAEVNAPRPTLSELRAENIARYADVGGPTSSMPSERVFADWLRRADYADVMALTDEIADARLSAPNGHSTKSSLRCAALDAFAVAAEEARWLG
jgi:hypothetical protein